MAYFSNGSEGECFDDQCLRCKYGDQPCPIAWVQGWYNYDAVSNETATKILDALVKHDGTCEMFKMVGQDFWTQEHADEQNGQLRFDQPVPTGAGL